MLGPGKSWSLFGNDADADAKIFMPAHLYSVLEQFLCYSQHVTVMNIYSCMDAAIVLHMWLVAAVCLYI